MRGIGGLAIGLFLAGMGAAAPAQLAQVDNQAVARACVPASQESRAMSDLSLAQRRAVVGCSLREAARQISAQLPIQTDEVTQLQDVSVEGAQLTYRYQVAVDAGQVTAEQRAAVVQSTRTRVCEQENMHNTISYGGSFRYIWNDRAGTELARTIIESC